MDSITKKLHRLKAQHKLMIEIEENLIYKNEMEHMREKTIAKSQIPRDWFFDFFQQAVTYIERPPALSVEHKEELVKILTEQKQVSKEGEWEWIR